LILSDDSGKVYKQLETAVIKIGDLIFYGQYGRFSARMMEDGRHAIYAHSNNAQVPGHVDQNRREIVISDNIVVPFEGLSEYICYRFVNYF
jgi:hypothetical protein